MNPVRVFDGLNKNIGWCFLYKALQIGYKPALDTKLVNVFLAVAIDMKGFDQSASDKILVSANLTFM